MFPGKKTYVAAAGLVAVAIGSFVQGDATVLQTVTVILEGLGLAALRAGVAKAD